MKKTLKKVYRDILGRAEYHRELDKKEQQENESYDGINRELAGAYLVCASWLEETEEINPTE